MSNRWDISHGGKPSNIRENGPRYRCGSDFSKFCGCCQAPFSKKKKITKQFKVDGWFICNKCAPEVMENLYRNDIVGGGYAFPFSPILHKTSLHLVSK